MLADIKQNNKKEYNYHILLCSLFGNDYKNIIQVDGKEPKKSKFSRQISPRSQRDHSRRGSRKPDERKTSRFGRDSRSERSREDRSERSRGGRSEKSRGGRSERSSRSRPKDGRSRTRQDTEGSGMIKVDAGAKTVGNAPGERSRIRDDRSRTKDGRSRTRDSKGEDSKARDHDRPRLRDDRSRPKDGRSMHRDSEGKSRGRRDRDRERSHADRSKSRPRSRAPKGQQAINIGKKLENSRYDYVDHLKYFAGDDKDYMLTDDQVFKILKAANIKLTKTEEDDFIRDLGDRRFTVEEFLNACQLESKEFGTGQAEVEIVLKPEEKEQAKKLLVQIGEAMISDKKEFEHVFNIGPYDKTVEFYEFKYGIENDINDEIARIAGDVKSITLLKNYLVENINVNQNIDVKFLFTNLFPTEGDRPELKSKMNCVTDFIDFLRKTPDIDINKEFGGSIIYEEFEKRLEDHAFDMSKENLVKLEEAFTNAREPGVISLNLMKRNINLLAPELLDKGKSVTKREIQDRLSHVDPGVKRTLTKINEYMKKERKDTMTFFENCDQDGDGVLTPDEFVDGILKWRIVGMKDKHLRDAFTAIDVNKDGELTLGEIWMYIEGAKPSSQERNIAVEREIEKDMKEQIDSLYNEFKDENKEVTKESMGRILSAFSIPSNVISKTLNNISTDHNGKISRKEFDKYMTTFLKENILEIENDINELRAMFYEADLNHSGFLDMDELYNFFNLTLHANITRDELKSLVQSVDLDYDGEVDIDEFITLMTQVPSEKGTNSSAQATYMRIKRNRKFDMTEFIKFLQKFPSHFQESFTARLYRNKFILPSSVFTSNIIPTDGDLITITKKLSVKPFLKPSDPLIAAQVLLEGAKGVPQPEEEKVAGGDVLKRVVRVSVFDFKQMKFIGNSSFILGAWSGKGDVWKFNKWSETGTNPLIFRTEEYGWKDNAFLVFEFVMYWKMDKENVKELNWGWCRLAVKELERKTGKVTMDIEGGSPELASEVSYLDKNKKRVKGKGQLTVSFRGLKDFSDESKFHFKMLPNT